jgi:DNA-directed RNA polymerase specialized sigma24 family protein
MDSDPESLLTINAAIETFSRKHPDKAELLIRRLFAGLSLEESAKAMGISISTAKRSWVYSRAWLYRMITEDPTNDAVGV